MENKNINNLRASVNEYDREELFAELFFANAEVNINITQEELYISLKEFILAFLKLENKECGSDDLLVLCKLKAAKDYKVSVDKLEEVEKPALGMSLSLTYAYSIAQLIEKALLINIHDEEFEKIKTVKEFSDCIFNKLQAKQKEDDIIVKSFFHENGKIAKQDYLLEHSLVALTKEYNENGVLISEVGYDDGIEYGCSKHFYDTGELYYMSYNCDGNKEFQEIEYYKNGNKRLEEDYVEGFMHGWSKTYNEKGELLSKDLYDEDILVERHIFKTGTVKFFDYTNELKEELYGSDWE